MAKKYLVLVGSLIIQACLGGVYAWSTFVPPLIADYGLSPVQTQLIFGTTIIVFTVAMIFAGRAQSRTGPRPVAAAGGLMFGAGYAYAAFSGGGFAHILLGIGVLSGIGIGMGYVCPLATCVKWFPEHKGLVTGVSVAAFGCGAIVLSSMAEHILARGIDVLAVFGWIAALYTVLIIAGAMLLDVPESTGGAEQQAIPAGVFRSRPFWTLCAGMFCGTFAGLMVIGNLKPIGLSIGIDPLQATMAIGAFAIGNGLGRIVWGWVLDRAGVVAIPLSLAVLTVAVIALNLVPGMNAGFVAAAFCIGFGFGSCFVVYAAHLGTLYGPEAVARVYPLVFLAYGFSGIAGPTAGGMLFELTGRYFVSIGTAAAVSCAGAVVLAIYAAGQRKKKSA
ncbi:MFS transporter [Kiritimatiella glycovorans]|uniref:Putative MFS-type transporter YhjX n=1 Tax=Kiritimatiella glycovorans TaxID=1307763 RepID=A0A0G3EF30_9BACT|nr:MFS transporter [Kiritimatiella glycovorans]AKJ63375.1 putative MFS-type transporter YhjX [Kiritimatiella glycovorans]